MIEATPAGPAVRVVAVVGAVASTVVIAYLDYLTGINLSLSAFYLIPVALVTLLVSPVAGYALATLAAAGWTVADVAADVPGQSDVLLACNGLFRFATISIVVALLGALLQTMQEAKRSEWRTKEFLSYAAHQLRTPTAGLQASVEALILTGENGPRAELLASIRTETGRMGSLVSALLRMARLDQGDPLQTREVSADELADLVRIECDRTETLAPRLQVGFDVRGRLPPTVTIDPMATAEIVANLLENAGRHATTRIHVTLVPTTDAVAVEIIDNGPGLPPGQEDRAFERFVSFDGRGGSGLGLSIARSLARAQHGDVVYADGCFTVTLATHARPAFREDPA
ncbi:MAG TPA: HAMP domain-containing sensor histidine kinase [Acidimicrobiales bacterium]